jgi:S-adenosylmethionine/arginine decarboxylase-like enzyme
MDDCPPEWKDIPHLNGISAVQFISTSNFTIHALTDLKAVYLNIFTCKDFDVKSAVHFAREYFNGTVVTCETIVRK